MKHSVVKYIKLSTLLILLSVVLMSVTSCNNDKGEKGIIVTVDEKGNAKGDHRFVKIDESNFYIDDMHTV